jgi:hypothetical protein
MESPLFGAFTHRLGIRAACVWSSPCGPGRPHAKARTRMMRAVPSGAHAAVPEPLAAPPCSVTLLDRLKGDQHYSSETDLEVYDARPGELVLQYIKNELRARAARSQV